MTIHSRFTGRLLGRPKRFGPRDCGFTTMELALSDPDVNGANEVHVLLDPETLHRKEMAEQALKWSAGDLVQLEGEVVKIGKCECGP